MPAVSEKQRRFFGAELGRKRTGKKTQTGMSEKQLEEFATMKHGKHSKSKMPAGASQSPSGDIGAKRQEESTKVGGFKSGSTVTTAGKF